MKKELPKELVKLFDQIDEAVFETLFYCFIYHWDCFIIKTEFDYDSQTKYFEIYHSFDGERELWILQKHGNTVCEQTVNGFGYTDDYTLFQQVDVNKWILLKEVFFSMRSWKCPQSLVPLQEKVLELRDMFVSEKLSDELDHNKFIELFGADDE